MKYICCLAKLMKLIKKRNREVYGKHFHISSRNMDVMFTKRNFGVFWPYGKYY